MAPRAAANDNLPPSAEPEWTDDELYLTPNQAWMLAYGMHQNCSEARGEMTIASLERRKMLQWLPAGKPGEYKLAASPKGKAALERYSGKRRAIG